ncbi:MAG TPA: sensor domain-containing diguanylate cyclase [Cellvibrionaceae bacterium]
MSPDTEDLPPSLEQQRLDALRRYCILDTPTEQTFDDITRLIADICQAPIAVINFIDESRQWFKSEIGLGVRETPLDISICAHAILQPGLFIVPDTLEDARFAHNPLVTGEPYLRFYAGALLETYDGFALGTLCVLDHQPRELSELQKNALSTLARQVMLLLELFKANNEQANMLRELEAARKEMAALAATDYLTGLLNRRAFSHRLKQTYGEIERKQSHACLMMMDLDHFKKVNDTHGHQLGDEVLQLFVDCCKTIFRAADSIGRWGGEEFIALLPHTNLDQATQVADRLRQAVAELPMPEVTPTINLTVSVSVIALDARVDIKHTLRDLDDALYEAKDRGRNCTVVAEHQR